MSGVVLTSHQVLFLLQAITLCVGDFLLVFVNDPLHCGVQLCLLSSQELLLLRNRVIHKANHKPLEVEGPTAKAGRCADINFVLVYLLHRTSVSLV